MAIPPEQPDHDVLNAQRGNRVLPLFLRLRLLLGGPLGAALVLWAVALLVLLFLSRVSSSGFAVLFGYVLAIGLVVVLWRLGTRRRYGRELRCASCGYLLAPAGVGERCPECGAAWLQPHGRRAGLPAGFPWLRIPAALLAILVALSLTGSTRTFLRLSTRIASTDALIRCATASNHRSAWFAWAELQDRQLTSGQRSRLIRAVLEMPPQWTSTALSCSWLGSAASRGQLSAQEIDRVVDGVLELRLSAPAVVEAGKSFDVAVEGRLRLLLLFLYPVHVVGSRIETTGPLVLHDSEDLPKSVFGFAFKSPTGGFTGAAKGELRFTGLATAPGTATVHYVAWIVSYTPGRDIQCRADGTPILPPGITRMKSIDLTRTITIRPAPASQPR